MSVKNFFWFLKEPADERENKIYSLAYNRAFKFLMLALSAVFILTAKLEFNVPAYVIFFCVFLLLIAAHLIGWLTLKNEDISQEENQVAQKAPLWLLYTLPIVFGLYAILVVFVLSEVADIFQLAIFGYGLMYLLLIAYSFLLARRLPLYIRLILSLSYPLFTIFFVSSKNYSRSKVRAVLESIGYNIVLVFGSILVIMFLRIYIFTPFYSVTNHFEPAIKNGQYMVISRISKKYYPGDFVVYRTGDKRYILAKVQVVEMNNLQVETASGTTSVEKNMILGKILHK